jgi:hypothetical protein
MTAINFLGSFDFLREIEPVHTWLLQGESSMELKRFLKVCDDYGLPRASAKNLVGAFVGKLQGGELDGRVGHLSLARDKGHVLARLGLSLLTKEWWEEVWLRQWIGKAGFDATFRRPVFPLLEEAFQVVEEADSAVIPPTNAVMEELVLFTCLTPLLFPDLRATLGAQVSCSEASESDGGTAGAVKLKYAESAIVKEDLETRWREMKDISADTCGTCGHQGASITYFACPMTCGSFMCSLRCMVIHRNPATGTCTYVSRPLRSFE